MKGNGNETFDIETQATNHPTKSTHLTNKSTSPKRPQFNDRSNPLHAKREQETFKKRNENILLERK
jgi:hypothetical protein